MAFTRYRHYQYCMLNGNTGDRGETIYGWRRRSAANKNSVLREEYRREDQYLSIEIQLYCAILIATYNGRGCNKGGVECQEKYWLVHNPRINKRISGKGQGLAPQPGGHWQAAAWPLRDIASANIVWHVLQKRMVGEQQCLAQ